MKLNLKHSRKKCHGCCTPWLQVHKDKLRTIIHEDTCADHPDNLEHARTPLKSVLDMSQSEIEEELQTYLREGLTWASRTPSGSSPVFPPVFRAWPSKPTPPISRETIKAAVEETKRAMKDDPSEVYMSPREFNRHRALLGYKHNPGKSAPGFKELRAIPLIPLKVPPLLTIADEPIKRVEQRSKDIIDAMAYAAQGVRSKLV